MKKNRVNLKQIATKSFSAVPYAEKCALPSRNPEGESSEISNYFPFSPQSLFFISIDLWAKFKVKPKGITANVSLHFFNYSCHLNMLQLVPL